MLTSYLYVFLISMVPLVELRGAVPVSQAMGLPLLPSYALCVIGNMLPVPVIYLFAVKVLTLGSRTKLFGKPCRFFLDKGTRAGQKLKANSNGFFWALLLFVGIPLPGTGAWTGTLAAAILGAPFKRTVAATTGGVALAGVIMAAASLAVKAAV